MKVNEMKLIVIGAGAAGLMAAGQAAAAGASVLVLEKNDRPGKKILITGNGRCNLTNSAVMPDFIKFIPGNGQFLFSCLTRFGSQELVDFFGDLGLETKTETDGRIFPVTDRASDVVGTLVSFCKSQGVEFKYNSPVNDVKVEDGQVVSVSTTAGFVYNCDALILAVGGASYPATGSTGDGYLLAKKIGHTIVPVRPSLVPMETKEKWVKEISGLSFQDAALTAEVGAGRQVSARGEMIFTHFGISGPAVLVLSRKLAEFLSRGGEITVTINLRPDTDFQQLQAEIMTKFSGAVRKQLQNVVGEVVPKSLIPVILRLSGIEIGRPVHQVTREERQRLGELIHSLPLTITGTRPLAEAIVTSGGVSIKEINPKTMASKQVRGLYFAGEVVDVDGYTGGFNLQAAFSMGYTAGHYAASESLIFP